MKLVKDPWPWQTDPEKREEYRAESLARLSSVTEFYATRTPGSGATDYWRLSAVVNGQLRGMTSHACAVGVRTVDSPRTGYLLTTTGYGISHLDILRQKLAYALGQDYRDIRIEEL